MKIIKALASLKNIIESCNYKYKEVFLVIEYINFFLQSLFTSKFASIAQIDDKGIIFNYIYRQF